MSTSPILGLTLMTASQAQKEVVFNEFLIAMDALFRGSVLDGSLHIPPSAPAEGDAYIINTGATGLWSGYDNQIAFYFNGWQFVSPPTKITLFDVAANQFYQFQGGTLLGMTFLWDAVPVSTVTVLKVVVATKPTSLIETKGPLSYEVDVLVRACANALGFDAVDGSHSADLADAVASHLFLVPSVQRGINGTYFGTTELSNIGTPTQLIHDRLMTLSPTMKPHQCFTGVVPFAVPLALGSRSDQTQYSLALASYPFFTYGNVQSVWWAPRAS